MEFWLVSVPGDPLPKDSWDAVTEKTGHLSANHKFNIPELKVRCMSEYIVYCCGSVCVVSAERLVAWLVLYMHR